MPFRRNKTGHGRGPSKRGSLSGWRRGVCVQMDHCCSNKRDYRGQQRIIGKDYKNDHTPQEMGNGEGLSSIKEWSRIWDIYSGADYRPSRVLCFNPNVLVKEALVMSLIWV